MCPVVSDVLPLSALCFACLRSHLVLYKSSLFTYEKLMFFLPTWLPVASLVTKGCPFSFPFPSFSPVFLSALVMKPWFMVRCLVNPWGLFFFLNINNGQEWHKMPVPPVEGGVTGVQGHSQLHHEFWSAAWAVWNFASKPKQTAPKKHQQKACIQYFNQPLDTGKLAQCFLTC